MIGTLVVKGQNSNIDSLKTLVISQTEEKSRISHYWNYAQNTGSSMPIPPLKIKLIQHLWRV
jgi:hypothetical protein